MREYEANGQESFPGNGKRRDSELELERLRRELRKTQMERDIFKKTLAIFSQPQAQYWFIEAYRWLYPVRVMCAVLLVSASGYYRWRKQPHRNKRLEEALLLAKIKPIHRASHGIYGSPRITAMLHRQGYKVSWRRVPFDERTWY